MLCPIAFRTPVDITVWPNQAKPCLSTLDVPDAKLVPIHSGPVGKRIGIAKGKFEVPDSIDAHNAEIARLFLGDQS